MRKRLMRMKCPYAHRESQEFQRLKEGNMTDRADFRQFYRDTHQVDLLTEREKKLIGLTIAIVRNCQP